MSSPNIFKDTKNLFRGGCVVKHTFHNCTIDALEGYIEDREISTGNVKANDTDFVYCGYGKSFFIPKNCAERTDLSQEELPVTLIFNTIDIFANIKEIRPFDSGFFYITNIFIEDNEWDDKKFLKETVQNKLYGRQDLSPCVVEKIIEILFSDYKNGKLNPKAEINIEETSIYRYLHDLYDYISKIIDTNKIEIKRLLTFEFLFNNTNLSLGNIFDVIVNAKTFKEDEPKILNFINKYESPPPLRLTKNNESMGADNGSESNQNKGNDQDAGIWEEHIEMINNLKYEL